jgi:hypothetical protein
VFGLGNNSKLFCSKIQTDARSENVAFLNEPRTREGRTLEPPTVDTEWKKSGQRVETDEGKMKAKPEQVHLQTHCSPTKDKILDLKRINSKSRFKIQKEIRL